MWLEYFEQYLDRVFPRFLSEKLWNYKDDLCMVGAEDLYCATGSESWREPVRRNASFLMDDAGRVANWVPGEHNIDKVSFGKSMRILRDVTGEARWAEGVERAYRILADYPRTVTGNFWHKDIYPDQVWLDGLYMGMPFYAACLAENGENHWDDILDQFTAAHKLLWDEQLGLYRHANDCSRKMEWADPITGQSPVVWLRAEGWFLMALADTYEIAKDRTPRAGELCPLLKNALDRLLPYQVADTGMFLQVVDRADLTGNYSETSGSAMVAYALMKGARLGGSQGGQLRAARQNRPGLRGLRPAQRQAGAGRHPGHLPEKGRAGLGASRHLRQRRSGTGTGQPHRPHRHPGVLPE